MHPQDLAKKSTAILVLYVVADFFHKVLTIDSVAAFYSVLTMSPWRYLQAVVVVSTSLTIFVLVVFFLIWLYKNVIK